MLRRRFWRWPGCLLAPDFRSGDERSRNVADSKALEDLCWGVSVSVLPAVGQSPGDEPVPQQGGPNEAAMLLIAQDLNIYLRNSAGAGAQAPSPPAGHLQANRFWPCAPGRTRVPESRQELLWTATNPLVGWPCR
jgi:hypothetical protein